MKTKNIFIVLAVAVAIGSMLYSFMGSQDQSAYKDEILKEREEKDRFMRTSDESPFVGKTETFTGLQYFPADVKFKITADLVPIKERKARVLSTNDGKEQRYIEYAFAEFDLDGFHNKLLILEGLDVGPIKGKLFLAFGDETSAGETYGAGRYLDVNKTPGSNTLTLDFNKAYNPYCAYVSSYSCPFPPAENLLQIALKAGEKIYHE